MITIFLIIFFVLGLIIGSFLNVVIFRFNTSKSLGGRSGCMNCQNKLVWHELIPVLSFLILKGRCRNCKVKISRQYPFVEFVTGLIFATLAWKFQGVFSTDIFMFGLTFAYYAVMFSFLVVIAVYDLRHKIIPDVFSLIFGLLSFLGLFVFNNYGYYSPHIPSLVEFASGPLVALPFALLWLVSKGKWMGLGDAKLALGLGWLVGLSRIFDGVVVAFWVGSIVGLFLVSMSRKYGMKSEIPFAPYLVLGTFLAFIFNLHLFGF